MMTDNGSCFILIVVLCSKVPPRGEGREVNLDTFPGPEFGFPRPYDSQKECLSL
jgi:hypothetical protein